jgi:hypothetical protein
MRIHGKRKGKTGIKNGPWLPAPWDNQSPQDMVLWRRKPPQDMRIHEGMQNTGFDAFQESVEVNVGKKSGTLGKVKVSW